MTNSLDRAQSDPIEIRLTWLATVQHGEDDDGPPYGMWTLATQDNRRLFEIVRQSLDKVHGLRTHWIEERATVFNDYGM